MVQSKTTKIKAGTEFTYNGEQVFVEHDREDGSVSVCWSKSRGLNDYYEVVSKEDLKPVKAVRTPISNKPKKTTEKEKNDTQLMDEFFNSMTIAMPFNCQNCNRPLYAYTKFGKRCVTAHLLPKSKFESVKMLPDNILFLGSSLLGICFCHNTWDDKGAEEREKMPIYPHALRKFDGFKHLLTDSELMEAYEYLGLSTQAALDYLNSK